MPACKVPHGLLVVGTYSKLPRSAVLTYVLSFSPHSQSTLAYSDVVIGLR
jgi:hypothetical protein